MLKSMPNRRRRGQALVEAALVITLFVLLVMGIIQFAYAFMIASMITNAARDGARVAVVMQNRNPDDTFSSSNQNDIRTLVINQIANVMDPSGLSVTVTQSTASGIKLVTVQVSGTVPLIFSLPGVGNSFTVSRQITFRDEV